jgi:hypothetical protein
MKPEQYQWELKEEVLDELFRPKLNLLPLSGFVDLHQIDSIASGVFYLDFQESEPWEVIDPNIHLPIF